jgi:hypothetical protein
MGGIESMCTLSKMHNDVDLGDYDGGAHCNNVKIHITKTATSDVICRGQLTGFGKTGHQHLGKCISGTATLLSACYHQYAYGITLW